MKLFVVASLLLAATCTASPYAAISSQYQSQDSLGQYAYGYADPNSQKHESRSADGVTHGGYSYVDGHGIVQSVKYTADPVHGFQVAATNLPKGPAPVHAAPAAYIHAAPAAYIHSAPVAYAAPWAGHYAAAPVALHAGVPVDTPEVQHAKAAHFAAHAAARANLHHLHKRSAWWPAAPAAIHNGHPVDTPEVQHAKAAHFAAHAAALTGHGHAAQYHGYAHNGAPVDTPEVQHAKAAHFAAHAAARSGHGHAAPIAYAHAPAIHNGVPVDTPEVQHAKAAHFAAVAQAKSNAYSAPNHYDDGHYNEPNHYDNGHYYDAPASHYQGPIHIPVIHNGVPVEPQEVQHARAAHLSALHEAQSRQGYGHGHYDDGHNQW